MLSFSSFSWRRVRAMIVRLWYGTLRSFDRLTDAFYWVTIDLIPRRPSQRARGRQPAAPRFGNTAATCLVSISYLNPPAPNLLTRYLVGARL
jgi:hypothetical protein